MVFSGKLRHTFMRAGRNDGAASADRAAPSALSAMSSTLLSPALLDEEERDLPWDDSDVTTDDDVALDTLTPDQFDSVYAGDRAADAS
jgi:hypothetical protein